MEHEIAIDEGEEIIVMLSVGSAVYTVTQISCEQSPVKHGQRKAYEEWRGKCGGSTVAPVVIITAVNTEGVCPDELTPVTVGRAATLHYILQPVHCTDLFLTDLPPLALLHDGLPILWIKA